MHPRAYEGCGDISPGAGYPLLRCGAAWHAIHGLIQDVHLAKDPNPNSTTPSAVNYNVELVLFHEAIGRW